MATEKKLSIVELPNKPMFSRNLFLRTFYSLRLESVRSSSRHHALHVRTDDTGTGNTAHFRYVEAFFRNAMLSWQDRLLCSPSYQAAVCSAWQYLFPYNCKLAIFKIHK
jgi:hypothetical protein